MLGRCTAEMKRCSMARVLLLRGRPPLWRRRRPPAACRLSSTAAALDDAPRQASVLRRARAEGWLMNRYGGVNVAGLERAGWIHDELVRQPGKLGRHEGWKCGQSGVDCAVYPGESDDAAAARQRFCAPLFSASLASSPATVTHAGGGMHSVDAKLGFVLRHTLHARSAQADPYTEAQVWEAVGSVAPCLEVCASRFTCPVPLAVAAADFGNSHAVVRGEAVGRDEALAAAGDGLANLEWRLDGGSSSEPSESPLAVLCWAANSLTGRGVTLGEGCVVLCGGGGGGGRPLDASSTAELQVRRQPLCRCDAPQNRHVRC